LPNTMGPYELRSELGRGAMAKVWRAYDPVLDREVAIKEPLLPRGVDSTVAAEFGARFVREGRAAAKLSHANIVTIHAADIYDGRAALVMELVHGETLGQMLARGSLGPEVTMSLLEQLLSAVGYAHERGIVHRDIKPDNVFVTEEGRVKLGDFGIASLASDTTLTQAGTIMGTPGYMAPEQVTGEPVDARADIFAIGVLAHEMLTGKNPFGASEGLPVTTIMYRIVHQAPTEIPPEALAGLPGDMRGVLEAALAKDPADRFPDAASFSAALTGRGPLPVPGSSRPAGAATPAAHMGGTILGRLSAIKSATMISRPAPGKMEATWLHSWLPYAAIVFVGLIVMIALLVSAKTGGSGSDNGASGPATTSTAAVVTTTTALPGTVVQITKYGAELTLPVGWKVSKKLMVDGSVSWFEAKGPQSTFARCISQGGWAGWHGGGPESYHEGDRRNFVKKHPEVVDVGLAEAWLGQVQGLRWDYAYKVNGKPWAGIGFYFPLNANSHQTPSLISVSFPNTPEMRAQVEAMLSTLRIPSGG
jgi:tRNA A-37 threonylcarbamoyl transferase component Bud32